LRVYIIKSFSKKSTPIRYQVLENHQPQSGILIVAVILGGSGISLKSYGRLLVDKLFVHPIYMYIHLFRYEPIPLAGPGVHVRQLPPHFPGAYTAI
jgi:hypothetical protein